MQAALRAAKNEGGRVTGGERTLSAEFPDAYYVSPAIVEMPSQTATVCQETFAPILYVMTYDTIDEAIMMQNGVPQGLSSSIFSNDLREAELFLSAAGSDCGIANVNIGTSGAEIGGAFNGEKETGGGRESITCDAPVISSASRSKRPIATGSATWCRTRLPEMPALTTL